jgi:D-alanyl-D-alanine carboxypeptidase (penicillin-binding protein 5/6)
MRMNVPLALVFLCTTISFSPCRNLFADDGAAKGRTSKGCQAELLMDATTGQVLMEQNCHKGWKPASLVKMMLMLLVAEHVEEGSISWDDSVRVSAAASRMGGSQVYLKQGEVFVLEELMEAIAIGSANDASYAVAEHVAGTAEKFVEFMNKRARQLGMHDTVYYNVHGLPAGRGKKDNVTSAFDCSVIARELLHHPKVFEWTSTRQTAFRNGTLTLHNTNSLIGSYPGADGLKTGYFSSSGFNIVATAARDGRRYIAVVLGSPSSKLRFSEAKRLLSQGFDTLAKSSL